MSNITKISNNLLLINNQKMDNNCYLLIDNEHVIIINQCFSGNEVEKMVDRNKYKILAILLAHEHFDHTYDTKQLVDKYNCSAYLFEKDKITYEKYDYADLVCTSIRKFNKNIIYFHCANLKINNFLIFRIFSRGHILGSVMYIWNNYVFTGDTLFADSYGRTDFVGGSLLDLSKSLKYLFIIFLKITLFCLGMECSTNLLILNKIILLLDD